MPAAPAGRAVPAPRRHGRSPLPWQRHAARLRAWLQRAAREPAAAALGARGGLRRSAPGRRAYWAFADRVQDHCSTRAGASGVYQPARSMFNANLLLTHAAAALAGHTGPARRDDRARALVNGCATAPRGSTRLRDGHAGARPGLARRAQRRRHPAPRRRHRDRVGARRSPGGRATRSASTRTADLIADRHRQHHQRRVLALAGAAAEPDQLVRADVRRRRDGRRATVGAARRSCCVSCGASSTAPAADGGRDGLQPRPRLPLPLPPAELRAPQVQPRQRRVREHRLRLPGGLPPGARRRGCRRWIRSAPPSSARWVERVLSGYWTHAGYLNWDTGLGFKRWHQGKKLGLSQAALLGIAVVPELDAATAPWAKHMLDRGFELFDRWIERDRGLPPANAFDVPSIDDNEVSRCSPPRACRPTRPRRRCSGWADGRRRAAAAVRLSTRTSAVSRSPRPPTTPRSSPSTAARSRTAGSSSRASSTASRTSPAASAGGRRRRSASSCGTAPAGSPPHPQRAVESTDDQPLRLLEPRGHEPPGPLRSPGRSERLRVRGHVADGGARDRAPHTASSQGLHRDRVAGRRRERQDRRGPLPRPGAVGGADHRR